MVNNAWGEKQCSARLNHVQILENKGAEAVKSGGKCVRRESRKRVIKKGIHLFLRMPSLKSTFFVGVIACVFSTCVFQFSTVIGHNHSNFHARSFARAHHSSFTVNEGCAFDLNGGPKRLPDSLTRVVESIISHPPFPFPSKTTATLTHAATLHVLFLHNSSF